MKGRELLEELPGDDEGGPGSPDLTCLNLSLPRSHSMVKLNDNSFKNVAPPPDRPFA